MEGVGGGGGGIKEIKIILLIIIIIILILIMIMKYFERNINDLKNISNKINENFLNNDIIEINK